MPARPGPQNHEILAMPSRHNFTVATKKLIALRANHQCVVPGCKNPTAGPGSTARNAANIGVASHIYAAATNGPRGQNGLGPEQISSVENGVWCCAYHGTLIDTNAGDAYPAVRLLAWKHLKDAQLQRAMDGQWSGTGWFSSFRISKHALFQPDATLDFSKVTVLQGRDIGKTAVLDWIAASAGRLLPNRWLTHPSDLLTELTYFAPDEKKIEFEIEDGRSRLLVERAPRVEAPRDLTVVTIPESYRDHLGDSLDDDARIATLFGVDAPTVRALEDDLRREGGSIGRSMTFKTETPSLEEVEVDEKVVPRTVLRARGISFSGLSGSERIQAVLELACALARHRALEAPTLLTLDSTDWNFDEVKWDSTIVYLLKQPFQTLLTRPSGWMPKDRELWRSTRRIRLEASASGAVFQAGSW